MFTNRMRMASSMVSLTWDGAVASSMTVSNAGLTLTRTGATGAHAGARSAAVITSPSYFEVDVVQATADNGNFGDGWLVGVTSATGGWDPTAGTYIGSDPNSWSFYGFNGGINGTGASGTGSQVVNGQVIGIAVDPAAGKVWFRQAGSWIGGGDPATGTGANGTGIPSAGVCLAGDLQNLNQSIRIRTAATYSVPGGFTFLGG